MEQNQFWKYCAKFLEIIHFISIAKAPPTEMQIPTSAFQAEGIPQLPENLLLEGLRDCMPARICHVKFNFPWKNILILHCRASFPDKPYYFCCLYKRDQIHIPGGTPGTDLGSDAGPHTLAFRLHWLKLILLLMSQRSLQQLSHKPGEIVDSDMKSFFNDTLPFTMYLILFKKREVIFDQD